MIIKPSPAIIREIQRAKCKIEDQEYFCDSLIVRMINSVGGNCHLYFGKKLPLDEKAKPKHLERGYHMFLFHQMSYNRSCSENAFHKSQQMKRQFENIKKIIDNPVKRQWILEKIGEHKQATWEFNVWFRDNIMLYIMNQGDAYAL